MATMHMILQSVSFLNHAIQDFNYKYDVMNYMYQITKLLKIDLKMAKIAKLGKMSLVVCYLLPWQLGI